MPHYKVVLIWRGELRTARTEATLPNFMRGNWQDLYIFEDATIIHTKKRSGYTRGLDAIFWTCKNNFREEDIDLVINDPGWISNLLELCETTTFEIHEQGVLKHTIHVPKELLQ